MESSFQVNEDYPRYSTVRSTARFQSRKIYGKFSQKRKKKVVFNDSKKWRNITVHHSKSAAVGVTLLLAHKQAAIITVLHHADTRKLRF
jgi:hypothetical protein